MAADQAVGAAEQQVANAAPITQNATYRGSLQQKLPPLKPGETMSHYCTRIRELLDLKQCRKVDNMDADGLYLYKRAVRGASTGNVLAQAGSIFHHCIVYLRADSKLSRLEMGPSGADDVANNIFEAVESGPVLYEEATLPEDDFPLLHIDVPHHALSDPAIQEAIKYADARPYHTVTGNCIHFADFIVRLLTGGAVLGAPRTYDLLCGTVPPVDSPLLGMLGMLGMTWLDVCDGTRLMQQYLQQHEPPQPLGPPLLLNPEAAREAAPAATPSATSRADPDTVNAALGGAPHATAAGGLHNLLQAALASAGQQPSGAAATGDAAGGMAGLVASFMMQADNGSSNQAAAAVPADMRQFLATALSAAARRNTPGASGGSRVAPAVTGATAASGPTNGARPQLPQSAGVIGASPSLPPQRTAALADGGVADR